MYAIEDPKPINDFMVQNFELRANWIFYQLLCLEVDRPAAEAESNCEGRGQKGLGAGHSSICRHC